MKQYHDLVYYQVCTVNSSDEVEVIETMQSETKALKVYSEHKALNPQSSTLLIRIQETVLQSS